MKNEEKNADQLGTWEFKEQHSSEFSVFFLPRICETKCWRKGQTEMPVGTDKRSLKKACSLCSKNQ